MDKALHLDTYVPKNAMEGKSVSNKINIILVINTGCLRSWGSKIKLEIPDYNRMLIE